MPQVSIIIPAYNSEQTILTTLNSIATQTISDFECIIVNDSSKDNTEKIVKQFCSNDSRFKLIDNTRSKGAQGARNTGVLSSSGKWLVFFDSDDIMEPDFLETLLSETKKNNADVYCCFSKVIDFNTKKETGSFTWKPNGDVRKDLLLGKTYIANNSSMILKSKILEIGLLDEQCPSFQELDTHIRLSTVAKYHTVEKYLVKYFRGRKDAISSDDKRTLKGYIYIFKKHFNSYNAYKHASLNFAFSILDFSRKISFFTFWKTYRELSPFISHLFLKYLSRYFYIIAIPFYLKLKKLWKK
jgi:glycosyltransferase involved in cell wall biosynthesis